MRAELGPVTVRWTGGGLYLEAEGSGLLLDAPSGVVQALGDDLPRVHGVLLSGERTGRLVGLLPLLAALEPHRVRDLPLDIRFPLGAERGAMVAETWVRGWPDRYPLTLDAAAAGEPFEAGPFHVETRSIRCGEPDWRAGTVVGVIGMAVRVRVGEHSVVWVPGAAPQRGLDRFCAGADLAVVEVGRLPWPRTDERWRLDLRAALELIGEGTEAWFPGDDGRLDPTLEA